LIPKRVRCRKIHRTLSLKSLIKFGVLPQISIPIRRGMAGADLYAFRFETCLSRWLYRIGGVLHQENRDSLAKPRKQFPVNHIRVFCGVSRFSRKSCRLLIGYAKGDG